MTSAQQSDKLKLIGLVLFLAVCLVIRLYGISSFDLLGDEFVDRYIVEHFLAHPNPFEEGGTYPIFQPDQTRFSHYLTALVNILGGGLVASRSLSALFGIATIAVLYFLAMNLCGEFVARCTALFFGLSSFHIAYSRLMMTAGDSIFLFFYVTSVYCFYRSIKELQPSLHLLSYAFAGAAIATKLFGVFLIPIYALYSPLCSFRRFNTPAVAKERTTRLIDALLLGAWWGIFLIPNELFRIKLGLYAVTCPVTISYLLHTLRATKTSGKGVSFVTSHTLLISIACALSPSQLSIGHLLGILEWFPDWNRAEIATAPLHEYFLVLFAKTGPLFFLLGSWGSWKLFSSKEPARRLLLALILLPLFVLSFLQWKLPQHMLIVFPFFCIATAVGFQNLYERFRAGTAGILLLSGVCCMGLGYNFYNTYTHYPYYQLDGSQYGDRFVGYNKAAYLTFEELTPAKTYLLNGRKDRVAFYFANVSLILDLPFSYFQTIEPFEDEYTYNAAINEQTIHGFDYLLIHKYSPRTAPPECQLEKVFAVDSIRILQLFACNRGAA